MCLFALGIRFLTNNERLNVERNFFGCVLVRCEHKHRACIIKNSNNRYNFIYILDKELILIEEQYKKIKHHKQGIFELINTNLVRI